LMSDAALASYGASFLHPYRSTGAVAGLGLTRSLASRLGPQRTVEFIALGRPLPADQAEKWGLVESVASEGEVVSRAVKRALALSQQPFDLRKIRQTTGASLFRDFGVS
jgi:enoyl-CoA hydratase/carnithine racemase